MGSAARGVSAAGFSRLLNCDPDFKWQILPAQKRKFTPAAVRSPTARVRKCPVERAARPAYAWPEAAEPGEFAGTALDAMMPR